ncbi:MAG: beta galactosidase jelly roll domain-containing protein [Cyclobacteriaceae bacterium]|nr:beta galactosidase jelly roll domain-containing protein [Cyclobacteriaceae bacterium]
MNRALVLLLMLLLPGLAMSQVIDLRGQWKFHIDDKPDWANANFDDSKWENIFTPSAWEDEGFHGYDGFAWYRTKFNGSKLDKNEIYYLGLGYIDDCDEVFVNGVLVGFSGAMPPKYKTAYNLERKYPLPADLINYSGENTIAIRVFDATLAGGIIDGRLGIYKAKRNKDMIVDLTGIWSFATTRQFSAPNKDTEWKRIMVPSAWEYQGYTKYDGYAWYQKTFTLPENVSGESLVLLLGMIDDFDKAYLNGELIGSTNDHRGFGHSQSYSTQRVYNIPRSVLKKGTNTLQVFVDDMGGFGGIYGGVIGIATQQGYRRIINP